MHVIKPKVLKAEQGVDIESLDVNISSKGDPDFVCNIEQGENPPNLFEAVTIEDCFEYETATDMSGAASGLNVDLTLRDFYLHM